MSPQDLLLWVFCLVDDEIQALALPRLRQRGPAPKLADSEVITIELVGEFWGLHTDKALFRHFRRYHRAEFPALASVHRTTFARQAANLWRLKQLLQERLARRLACGDPVWLADSLPVDACQFARATFCKRFYGLADYGYDHVRKRTFYGFRLHLRVSREGVILAYELAPARAADRAVLEELNPPPGSTGIGDRGYWDPALQRRLAARGVRLLAPYQHKSKDPDPARSRRLSAVRYRIETVNGQLAERYGVKRTWARDQWHLCHRLVRKILSHTALIWVAFHNGLPPLSFDRLLEKDRAAA
jgi:hypothetical protein